MFISFDFTDFFSGHFDTKIGPKVECNSYKKISESIECQPSKVLFVTDVVKGTFLFFILFVWANRHGL